MTVGTQDSPADGHLSNLQQRKSIHNHWQGLKGQLQDRWGKRGKRERYIQKTGNHLKKHFYGYLSVVRFGGWGVQDRMRYLFGVVIHHAGGVIHSQTDLILPLAGFGPSQPDFIFAELAGNVRDDLAHVQSLPRAEISPIGQLPGWKSRDVYIPGIPFTMEWKKQGTHNGSDGRVK